MPFNFGDDHFRVYFHTHVHTHGSSIADRGTAFHIGFPTHARACCVLVLIRVEVAHLGRCSLHCKLYGFLFSSFVFFLLRHTSSRAATTRTTVDSSHDSNLEEDIN